MATIKAFKAVRPKADLANKVAALPYDVMNEKEAREMVKGNPHSFLHIDRPEINFDEGANPYAKSSYEKAREVLDNMIKENVLIKDNKPCLYIYTLTMDGRKQTGLVVCTSVNEYLDDTIKKHEFTRKDKEQDRINHVDYCDANTGPIFLAYRGEKEIDGIIENFQKNNAPVYDYVAEDGIGHSVWVIEDEKVIDSLVNQFKTVPNLYIADGHHRNASAVAVAKMRREDNKNYTGEEEFNYYLSVLFPSNQLKILDYNRLIKDLNGHSNEEFMELLKKDFTVEEFNGEGNFKPTKQHEFGMYFMKKWYKLTAKDVPNHVVNSLDVALLQNRVLTPILGIEDPRVSKRVEFIGGIRGIGELVRRVEMGDGVLAFAMFPTSMDELMAVADSGNVMPPKSTWFEPKLRSGLFIHQLK